MEDNLINIDSLLKQGTEILDGISLVSLAPGTIYQSYSVYRLPDEAKYECWKNVVIRFLSANYFNDVSIVDFRKAMDDFEKKHYSPTEMRKMLGVLEAYKILPNSIAVSSKVSDKASVVINNTNSQTQNQSQNVDVIIKSLEDTLTVSQIKELKRIIEEVHGDNEKAKPKLFDKIKSFGENLAPSIVANFLTNPSVWSALSNRW